MPWSDDEFDAQLAKASRTLAERHAAAQAEAKARAEAAHYLSIPFLPTSVAERVFNVVERCMCMRRNGLVIGVPGIGKTAVLKEAQRRSDCLEGPEVAVIKVEPSYSTSTMAVLEDMAPHLGVRVAQSVTATVRRIKREASFKPIVIFDETQNLSLRTIHQLLSISEEADIRMIFVGNPEALKHVNSTMADVRLVSRRLPYRDEINAIMDADVDLVANYFGVEGMAGYHLCRRIGAVFHMDGVVELLRETRRQAGDVKTLRQPAIQAALEAFPQFVAGLVRAETPASALRQRTAPRRLAAS